MPLLPDELKTRLPKLDSQTDELNPVVYARLYMPGTSWNWYVIEGGLDTGDWLLSCFFSSSEVSGFCQFLLYALEALRGPEGQLVTLDPDFPEGPLTDVVPAPDL
jgi:hypothetical protein